MVEVSKVPDLISIEAPPPVINGMGGSSSFSLHLFTNFKLTLTSDGYKLPLLDKLTH